MVSKKNIKDSLDMEDIIVGAEMVKICSKEFYTAQEFLAQGQAGPGHTAIRGQCADDALGLTCLGTQGGPSRIDLVRKSQERRCMLVDIRPCG